MEAKTIRPPIVGVPALAWCSCGPSSRMCWPNSRTRSNSMNLGPRKMQISIAAMPAIRTSPISAPSGSLDQLRQLLGDGLQAGRARALDQHRVSRAQVCGQQLGRLGGVGDQLVWPVLAGRLADPDQQVDAMGASVLADLAVVPRGARSQLAHLAEHGDG